MISYFKIDDAKNAFNRLMDLQLNEQRIQVAYVYDEKVTLLSSIHESSDSSKSDRSEDGSDSEKKKPISLTDKNDIHRNAT